MTLMLAGGGAVYAASDNQGTSSDEGIPGVLKYAQQYQREKDISSGEQKRQVPSGHGGISAQSSAGSNHALHTEG